MLQIAVSITFLLWKWQKEIVSIMFLNIGDECQSICNDNPTKATVILMLRLEVHVLKMMTTIYDDDC